MKTTSLADIRRRLDNDAWRRWWHNEGSGMPPIKGEDAETHVKRITQIAWLNGAYSVRYPTIPYEKRSNSKKLK